MLTFALAFAGIVLRYPWYIISTRSVRKCPSFDPLVLFILNFGGHPLITILFILSYAAIIFSIKCEFVKLSDYDWNYAISICLYNRSCQGGLQAIDKGQVSFKHWHGLLATNYIYNLTAGIAYINSSIVNTFIALFKDTSLVSIIGLLDLLGAQNSSRSLDWNGYDIEAYMFAGLVLDILLGMSIYSQKLERKLDTDRNVE